jgi:hypothetical protein
VVRLRHLTPTHCFSCSIGPDVDSKRARRDTLRRTCVFPSSWICGSRSAFQCIRGAVSKKAYQDKLCRTCVHASGGICGSRSALRYILGMKCRRTFFHARVGLCGFQKSAPRHVMSNLRFCFRWDPWVRQCIVVRLGHVTSTHYFSCSIGPDVVSKKARRDTLRRTCVFPSS